MGSAKKIAGTLGRGVADIATGGLAEGYFNKDAIGGALNSLWGDITGSNAASTQKSGINTANATMQQGYGNASDLISQYLGRANANLSNYSDTGNNMMSYLNQGMQSGQFTQTPFSFNAPDLANDPGYQFQLSQGQDAIKAMASANGSYGGGKMGTDLLKYSQGLAQEDYNNAYSQQLQGWEANAAEKNSMFGNLLSGANMGRGAASQLSQNNLSGGGTLADLLLGASGYSADSSLGRAGVKAGQQNNIGTSLSSLLSGGYNAMGGASGMSDLLKMIMSSGAGLA